MATDKVTVVLVSAGIPDTVCQFRLGLGRLFPGVGLLPTGRLETNRVQSKLVNRKPGIQNRQMINHSASSFWANSSWVGLPK